MIEETDPALLLRHMSASQALCPPSDPLFLPHASLRTGSPAPPAILQLSPTFTHLHTPRPTLSPTLTRPAPPSPCIDHYLTGYEPSPALTSDKYVMIWVNYGDVSHGEGMTTMIIYLYILRMSY
jgi:hypothetical protein